MVLERLNYAFSPRSIAVAGASENPLSAGYGYLYHLVNNGYQGKIYPVTPRYQQVLGFKAYPTLRDIPEFVDYVICCIPASEVLPLLKQCPEKEVKAVHLFTARFSETGQEDTIKLERELLQLVREFGITLIGPNCYGIYCPKVGTAFAYDFPTEPGKLGMFNQSGGASAEFIYYASLRGVRFSKVISYGNATDLNEADLLEYFSQDDESKIIASYIEGTKDGRRFVDILSRTTPKKPVIILKAGRGNAGVKAAASHTAAMAGSLKVWEAAINQAGAIQARSMEDMIDLAVSFYFLPPRMGTRVGIAGGGGGRAVLSADEWEEAGFNVTPLPKEIEEEIRKTLPEMWWGWVRNPVDFSIFPGDLAAEFRDTVLRMMTESEHFDLIVSNISIGGPTPPTQLASSVRRQVEGIIKLAATGKKPLAVILNTGTLGSGEFDKVRWTCLAEEMSRLIAARIPVYPSASQAARAVKHLVNYYQRKQALA
ncbi:CoA-binding protein [Chloroflexota bacterium]